MLVAIFILNCKSSDEIKDRQRDANVGHLVAGEVLTFANHNKGYEKSQQIKTIILL
jgi:hypothetical protein